MSTEIQHVADGSAIVRLVRTVTARLRSQFADADATVSSATRTSVLARGVRTPGEWIRNASLYRWLTAEPDPDVVVIDLRETWTVGPIVTVLDRLAPLVKRAWQRSLAARVTAHLRTASKRVWITESRTVQLIAATLEPPDPPEDAGRPSSEDDR